MLLCFCCCIRLSFKIRLTKARQVRSENRVPAVIYGGNETIHFSAPVMAFRSLVYTPEFQYADIILDGKTYRTIIKDLQFDVVTDELNLYQGFYGNNKCWPVR